MRILVSISILTIVVIACGSPAEMPIATSAPVQTLTIAPTDTRAPTSTRLPTNTPLPSVTPRPTATPLPTGTATPQPTATPLPQPIKLSGSGDSVVDIEKGNWPAIARIKYTGGRNFIVTSLDKNGKTIDLIVNTIGAYSGVRLIDAGDNEHTTRLEIESSGSWSIEIVHVTQARRVMIPAIITGTGDDVIILDGRPDLGKVDASKASRNFIILAYGADGRDLVVNKIAPYQGTIILTGKYLLEVTAMGLWSIDVTGK